MGAVTVLGGIWEIIFFARRAIASDLAENEVRPV
jgi:hypothetical protein